MTKRQQRNRLAKNQSGDLMVEQSFAIDDSLLPSAIELEKLHKSDNKIKRIDYNSS